MDSNKGSSPNNLLGHFYPIKKVVLQEMYQTKLREEQERRISDYCTKLRTNVLSSARNGLQALLDPIPVNLFDHTQKIKECLNYIFPDSEIIVNNTEKTVIISWK
jgi:hypothetical protein